MKLRLASVLILLSFNAHADLNKWVDSEGVVHYSDTRPDAEETTTLRSPSSSTGAKTAAPERKTIFEQEADLKKAQKAKEEAAQKASQQEENARVKQQNCERARNQLLTLQNAPRIASYDANGERIILDDEARQRAIDEAQKSVSDYCN